VGELYLADAIFRMLEIMQHELLLFSAIWLLIAALDDLSIDMIWISRWLYRRFTVYRLQPPLRASQLAPPKQPGLLAIFVPTWREADVIGTMLSQCTDKWRGGETRHRIYVGCYPNDSACIAEVARAAVDNSRIRLVLLAHDGPTTKADCLNRLWQALLTDELASGCKAKAIVLHDAEDSVHADELRIFDRMIEKAAAVQLPVVPVPTSRSRWISAHYCDEFAEAHGKTMVVREAIGAALPLAGVGCAIDRNLLGRIAFDHQGRAFDDNSLTEDYELGLKIGAAGGRAMLARMLDDDGNLIGTRACFPDTLDASVRQKTRWLTGIALAGWDRLGWGGSLAEKWMRLHDRRSIFAAVVLLAAYLCIMLTAILALAEAAGLFQPKPLSKLLLVMLAINAIILLWRLAVRAAFVAALYGGKEAMLSVPRSLIANVISIMAARRACFQYIRHCHGVPLTWDKTDHHVVPQIATQRD
jgi:bacteriophage N4 adsorption protein B